MFRPQPIWGRVLAYSGESPGPASGITYTIEWWQEGTGVLYASGLSPSIPRWPDSVKVDAYPVDTLVQGMIWANEIRWLFRELPSLMECQDSNGGGGALRRPPTFGSGLGTGTPPGGGGGGGGEGTTGPGTDPGGGGLGDA